MKFPKVWHIIYIIKLWICTSSDSISWLVAPPWNRKSGLWIYFALKTHFSNTGSPQIVRFLRPQGTVLLRKPYYSGTDLVLKLQFLTFGFSKSPFFDHFQAILIFETKKWLFGFILKCLLSYLSQILTSLQDFRQFLTYTSTYCIIFGYTFSDFCNNHQ